MRRGPWFRIALGVLGAGVLLGVAGTGFGAAPAVATTCGSYVALAAADGARTFTTAPGGAPTDVDGAGPMAQAEIEDPNRSVAYAAAPGSNAVANNAGAANVDVTQVPTFALTQYTGAPATASHSTPAFTVTSASDEHDSSAKALAGGPANDQLAAGQALATASVACADDGKTTAVAESRTQMIDVEGVLRIASVRTIATVTITPTGERVVDSKIVVDGVTVGSQMVGLDDSGIVAGGSATPVGGDNPLADALSNAGITVHTVAATKNGKDGSVVAPALEITVTRGVSGVGTGPPSTTYTFGRAFARASASSDGSPLTGSEGSSGLSSSPPSASAPLDAGTPTGVTTTGGPTFASRPTLRGPSAVPLAAQRIANVSTASLYPAIALGALVLAAAGLIFRYLGVRLRWN